MLAAMSDNAPVRKQAVIVSREGMGSGDPELGLRLLRKYLNSDLERDELAERYVFYNGGVKAALLDEEVNSLLKRLEQRGAMIILCGTCLDHFQLTSRHNVGRNGCMGDVRESMAMARADHL